MCVCVREAHLKRIYGFNKTENRSIFLNLFATFSQTEIHICVYVLLLLRLQIEYGYSMEHIWTLSDSSFHSFFGNMWNTKNTRIANLFIFISCIASTNKNHSIPILIEFKLRKMQKKLWTKPKIAEKKNEKRQRKECKLDDETEKRKVCCQRKRIHLVCVCVRECVCAIRSYIHEKRLWHVRACVQNETFLLLPLFSVVFTSNDFLSFFFTM